jgi:predicted DNA-binding transcriptional regulator AlpA
MAGIDYDAIHLMGAKEISIRLRITRQRAYVLTGRRSFPPPRWKLAMGDIWLAQDVEAWIKQNRPHLTDDPDAL